MAEGDASAGDAAQGENAALAADPVRAGHSMHGQTFNEGPRQGAVLLEGMGEAVVFPATSSSPEAQAFIRQGVAQLHGFWYLEAERSFRQAAALDPNCAIAYWGMAMANTNNAGRAKVFIAEADKRKEQASPREKLYIAALHTYLHAEDGDRDKKRQRAESYLQALEDIVLEHPEDLEARALIAHALWEARRDELPIASSLAVDALLRDLFAQSPMHPAHHFLIHLWDYRKPEKALASAALCGPAAPGIAHMWHMPGHIYSRLHRYEDAVWQQEASARVDHAHQMGFRVMPDEIFNFAHNNEWLIRNLSFVGRVEDGLSLAQNMVSLPRHPRYNTAEGHGSSGMGRERLYDLLGQWRLWELTLDLADTPYLEPNTDEGRELSRLGLIGNAAAALGRGERVEAVRADLNQRLATIDQESEAAVKAALEAFDRDNPEMPASEAPAQGSGDAASGDAAAQPMPMENQSAAAPMAAAPTDAAPMPEPREVRRDKAAAEARKPFEARRERIGRRLWAIQAHEAYAAGDFARAHTLLNELSDLEATFRAEVRARSGDVDGALTALDEQISRRPGEVLPVAVKVWVLEQAGRSDEALAALEVLRNVSSSFDLRNPLIARLESVARRLEGMAQAEAGFDWRKSRTLPDDLGPRPDLASLGPFRWSPPAAPAWQLVDSAGESRVAADVAGTNRIMIFYLGAGCLHCVEQLKTFAPRLEEFRALGIEVTAISIEDLESLQRGLKDYGDSMPIPLLSDESLATFKAYRCFDDFENVPLHGTFLIDAQDRIRWQDIGPEPFNDVEFLLRESKRLLQADGAKASEASAAPDPVSPSDATE